MSNFELALVVYEKAGVFVASLTYRSSLFKEETIRDLLASYEMILEQILQNPAVKVTELRTSVNLQNKSRQVVLRDTPRTLAVTATFTADLLETSLSFWMRHLDMPARIEFAPYHQVVQQLLDPHSVLSRNRDGFNILLIRLAIKWRGAI